MNFYFTICRLIYFLVAILFMNASGFCQGTLSATYSTAHIPTSYQAYDSTCNGNNIILQLTLPAGESYTITGIDINYDMTAYGGGTIGQQRSQVKCINTQITEPEASYILKSPGTWHYSRQNVNIANGTYAGGTVLTFEMHAWRTGGTPGCNTLVNRVDNNTWTITLHYSAEVKLPKTGINDVNPLSTLDVNGKIKLGDDIMAPQAGMMRWNSVSKDFEGYNGTQWLSLTNKGQNGGWGNYNINEYQKVQSWNGDFDAETNDRFGISVCVAGKYAIIGKPGKKEVHIFKDSAENWLLSNLLISSSGTEGNSFGQSVAISENYAIIGSPYKTVGTNVNQGAVYIYDLNDKTNQLIELTSTDGSTDDNFGSSIAISGDYAIIGAPGKEINGKLWQGKAYIFKRMGNTWTQHTDLVASDGLQQDLFGNCVSISGDYAIVGANGKNGYAGCAYIFARKGDTWIEQSILLPADYDSIREFGHSVGISGNYVLIGAPSSVQSGVEKGCSYVFLRNGSTWTEQAKLNIPEGAHNDKFGQSVSISGDNAIVGASGKYFGSHPNPNNLAPDKRSQGKVYVFHNNGTMWQEQAGFTASDGKAGDYFGETISISGKHIIIGAPMKTVDGKEKAGAAYFFKK